MINLENVKKWTAALREPDRVQVNGALTGWIIPDESDPVLGDCCLGVGCKVAEVPMVVHGDLQDTDYTVEYGATGNTGLPPEEFHLWLGTIDHLHEVDDYEGALIDPADGTDVYLAIPSGVWTVKVQMLDGTTGGTDLRDLNGCSMLNDTVGLTFPQIADMIDYFGIEPIV